MNKVLEVQKIIVNSAKNIEYLQQNKIGIFVSVPSKIKMPYIKVIGLSTNNNLSDDIKKITFNLFVATTGKSNIQISEIMECLYLELKEKIYEYIDENKDIDIKILNIYNIKYNISENLQNNFWNGCLSIDFDII